MVKLSFVIERVNSGLENVWESYSFFAFSGNLKNMLLIYEMGINSAMRAIIKFLRVIKKSQSIKMLTRHTQRTVKTSV